MGSSASQQYKIIKYNDFLNKKQYKFPLCLKKIKTNNKIRQFLQYDFLQNNPKPKYHVHNLRKYVIHQKSVVNKRNVI